MRVEGQRQARGHQVPHNGQRPKDILSVIRYPIGGIRSYLRYTYPKFESAQNWRLTLVTVDRPEARLLAGSLAPLAVNLRLVPERRATVGLWREARALLATREFTLMHSQGLTAGVVSALADVRRRTPHVTTLHETFRPEQFAGVAGAAKRRFLAAVVNRFDRLIVVGEDARDNLNASLPLTAAAAARVRVIPNGVDVGELECGREGAVPFQTTCGWPAETVVFAYVGRFMPEKGFDVLIDAAALLAGRAECAGKFRVVALNDGAFVREYQRALADRRLGDYFAFPGFRASVAGALASVDAVVVPSRREACPMVAMEAMVVGRPLVASDCLGLREVTRDTPAVVCKAGDAASLASAMAAIIADPQARVEAAARFSVEARRRFDSGVTARKLEAVFDEALADRRGGAMKGERAYGG